MTNSELQEAIDAIEREIRSAGERLRLLKKAVLAQPDESLRPYTPETLAERWKCSHQHVRDLIRSGRLQAFRVGRLIRISRQAVLDHEVAYNRAPPAEPEMRTAPRVVASSSGR